MSSSCCIQLAYSCEQVIRSCTMGKEIKGLRLLCAEDRAIQAFPNKMDIALLQERYNWIREKQKLQTCEVLYGKASNKQEVWIKSLVTVVPVSHEVKSEKVFVEQLPVLDVDFSCLGDIGPDQTAWHAHLGIHRMISGQNNTDALNDNVTRPLLPRHRRRLPSKTRSLEIEGTCDKLLTPEKLEEKASSRKLSAPAALCRQWSMTGYQPPVTSTSSLYYPFPHRKSPRKSEAARRLGMYSTF